MKNKIFLLICALCAVSLDSFLPMQGSGHMITGTLIGALITGAAVVTTFAARDHLDQFLLLGDIDTAIPISGLQVEFGGRAKINLTGSQPLVSAFAKYMNQIADAPNGIIGTVIKIATGRVEGTTTYKFTNNGVTTPNIFAWSQSRQTNGQVPAILDLATVGIQAGSYEDFEQFSALFITSSANVGSIDIDYEDGHKESGLTVIEVDAMLAMNQSTEANGRLDAVVTTIDNRPVLGNPITRVRVYVPVGGTAVTVAVLKLADGDFKRLRN